MSMMLCPRCWNLDRPCDKCENKGKIPDVRLSENFMLSEFLYSPTAIKQKIPNDPTVRQVDRLVAMCKDLLQPLRAQIGELKITSGYRSPALNKAIKGSTTSAHMEAFAADVQPQKITQPELMHWFAKAKRSFDQVILEPGWVHIGYKHPNAAVPRRQLLVKTKDRFLVWKP